MARARVYLASEAARQQLEALEESYQRESNWRKSESERALQRRAGLRQVPRPWMARVASAATTRARGAIAEDGDELVHASLRLARAASRSFMSCSNFAMIF
jgi:hypothetical protein